MPHEIPPGPWLTVATNIFQLCSHHYILVADMYSKMPFVRHFPSLTMSSVISFLKNIFSVLLHGIPTQVMSDNGPQYASREFKAFACEWEYDHVSSSPHFAQSNGFIDRMGGTVKNILKKAKESRIDPQLALLCLWSTPVNNNKLPSPAKLLFNRKIRSNLPSLGPASNETVVRQISWPWPKPSIAWIASVHAKPEHR